MGGGSTCMYATHDSSYLCDYWLPSSVMKVCGGCVWGGGHAVSYPGGPLVLCWLLKCYCLRTSVDSRLAWRLAT